jgi:hypothetical protein
LYVFSSCEHLIDQLKSAPVATDGVQAGEAVDPKWESQHGHAHASARYGAMSRPSPSKEPERWENVPPHLRDWNVDPAEGRRELLDRHHKAMDDLDRRRPERRTERV